MERWLPPRAPGANPPPRFDAAPPAEVVPDEAPPVFLPPAAAAPGAPSGWAPPAPPRESTPGSVAGTPVPAVRPAAPRATRPPRPAGITAASARPNPHAVWALVLGITGLTLLLLSFGTLFLVTLPCSAAAWVLARRAAARIELGETAHGGGQASAALWLGRIGVLAGMVALVAFIALTVSGFDFEALREDLERDLERRRDGAR